MSTDRAGVVLAAGEGRRLRPLTDDLPKTLLPIDGDTTILDVVLANLSAVGVRDVHVVTGFAAEAIEARHDALERRHGVTLTAIFNEHGSTRNNAYSLWLAREVLGRGAFVVNGDTVHPAEVERRMLRARGPGVSIALDDRKALAEEEMKVDLDEHGSVARISKALDPATAAGEYIGVTLVEATAAEGLADALEATWRRDPSLYYEDGFQAYVDGGGTIAVVPVGGLVWVEVDDHDDLARAKEVACRS